MGKNKKKLLKEQNQKQEESKHSHEVSIGTDAPA